MPGPLHGIRIVEFAGIGPGPFCGMMLADHGAEVVRIERPGAGEGIVPTANDPLLRSRRVVALDMKSAEGIATTRALCARADGLIEGFRPGVMERLGLGPDSLLVDNPKLVYGRMTGWGQHGPLAATAGHDIDYIAISGALHTVGRAGERPVPPVNYLGDFAGGGMMLAFGMVAALLAARSGGASGQVIDAAMTDGSALIASMTWGFMASGRWQDRAGVNLLDGGAHFYDTYECADGKYLAVGAIEPQFYAILCDKLGLAADAEFDRQMDPRAWGPLRERLAALLRTEPRDHWAALFDGTDACVAPVLSLGEAPDHPHNAARGTFTQVAGHPQPAPAPRYSITSTERPRPPAEREDAAALLAEWAAREPR